MLGMAAPLHQVVKCLLLCRKTNIAGDHILIRKIAQQLPLELNLRSVERCDFDQRFAIADRPHAQ